MGKRVSPPLTGTDHLVPIADFNDSESVSDIQFLIPNPAGLRGKLGKLLREGVESIEILADFDQTISRYRHNGQVCPSSHRILQLSGLFSTDFETEVNRLYKHYHTIEADPDLDYDTKYKEMDAWWDITHGMIVEQLDLMDFMLPEMLKNSNLALRHGVDSVLERCKDFDVPFTVVSAGIGNFVEAALHPLINYPGFHIFSNFLHFDLDGHVQGFSKPNIHSLSKSAVLRDQIQRPNAVLLGDMPTDTLMVQGNKYQEVLSIGFLNDPTACLEDYRSRFDILVLGDGNFDLVHHLLSYLHNDQQAHTPHFLPDLLNLPALV